MNLKKSALTLAILSVTAAIPAESMAVNIRMNFDGLFTMLTPDTPFAAIQNVSKPYYYDATWGYGLRTQISGTLQYDTVTGKGSASVNPFEFFSKGQAAILDVELQAIGRNLLLGNFNFFWNGNNSITQIVLDGSGLFAEIAAGVTVGEEIDTSSCAISDACATPASNSLFKTKFPIGPAPIATSSFNTSGQTGANTTLSQLSLGIDDGIGGSVLDNGPFSGFNINLDITNIVVTSVPVPASIWLFSTGFISLLSLSRRKKYHP